ncbi:glycogen synthase [bacterium]|nr:glycogen synthase [bacterium]
MNILIASTEATPIAKAGGLGDMVSFLAKEWESLGHNPIIVLPKYGFIDINKYGFRNTFKTLIVQMGYWNEYASLWEGRLPNSEVPVYLIEHDIYFNREGIYGGPIEYSDNDRRFIFLSKAIFEVARAIGFSPDIIHSNDYHTAFSMAFLKEFYNIDPLFSKTKGVFSIHNIAHQGRFNPNTALLYAGFGFDRFYPFSPFEFYGSVNAMKVGIVYADKVTTVSPTYAREVHYPYFGEGLEGVINAKGNDFIGILNGVDYTEWNPKNDTLIYQQYDEQSLSEKVENKHSLLRDFGLANTDNLDLPLIGIVSRLAEQKGIDLIINKIESLLDENDFRFFILGSGEYEYEQFFNYLCARFPKKAITYIGHNNALSHKVIAASDYLLMPSRYEPCGLTQMFALRYGTIPIVRETGGLADTVREFNPENLEGTGFTFFQYNADDMAHAMRRALNIYNVQPYWDKIRLNAMNDNFAIRNTAAKYLEIFESLK